MDTTFFRGWTVRRLFYLGAGAVVVIQGIQTGEWLGLLLGGYFIMMAVLNVGCAAGCAVPMNRDAGQADAQVHYEEVKDKNS